MLTVSKEFSFCYGHFLPDYDGKCCVQHGHEAKLKIEVFGPGNSGVRIHPDMICDFNLIKTYVNSLVIDTLDHKNINDLPIKSTNSTQWKNMVLNPTCENMLQWVVYQLKDVLDLYRVRLYEGPTAYAEWRRDLV